MQTQKIQLKIGGLYEAKDKERWACFQVDMSKPEHAVALCIQQSTLRIEYFYLDGRYDSRGKREHTLIKEITAD